MRIIVVLLMIVFFQFDLPTKTSCFTSPKCIWPLSGDILNGETKEYHSQGHIGCETSIAAGHPKLNYDSLEFNGTDLAYVDLHTCSGISYTDDFTFILFIYPYKPFLGTIFQYLARDETDVNMITQIIVHLNMTLLSFEFRGSSGQDYGSADLFSSLHTQEQWQSIEISHSSSGEIIITYDQGTVFYSSSFKWNIPLKSPGIIRIGRTLKGSPDPFHGRVTCFQIYDAIITKEIGLAMEECLPIKWDNIPLHKELRKCQKNEGYYGIVARDASPSDSIATVRYMSTSSITKCASLCKRTPECLTFVVNKVKVICKLYSALFSTLDKEEHALYYKRTDL